MRIYPKIKIQNKIHYFEALSVKFAKPQSTLIDIRMKNDCSKFFQNGIIRMYFKVGPNESTIFYVIPLNFQSWKAVITSCGASILKFAKTFKIVLDICMRNG